MAYLKEKVTAEHKPDEERSTQGAYFIWLYTGSRTALGQSKDYLHQLNDHEGILLIPSHRYLFPGCGRGWLSLREEPGRNPPASKRTVYRLSWISKMWNEQFRTLLQGSTLDSIPSWSKELWGCQHGKMHLLPTSSFLGLPARKMHDWHRFERWAWQTLIFIVFLCVTTQGDQRDHKGRNRPLMFWAWCA